MEMPIQASDGRCSGGVEGHQRARIMIVDDDFNTVASLRRLLDSEGFETHGFTDAQRAIAHFAEVAPDLILLDWHMGKETGSDVIRALRAGSQEDDLPPILVLSGDTHPETRRTALKDGVADFVMKPYEGFEVVLRIQNHLRLRQLHEDVKQQNARLEEIVHQRTAKLRSTVEELKHLQQQVIEEERMRAFSIVAGGVAHDFNNSLMIIRGFSELYSHYDAAECSQEDLRKGFELINLASHDAGDVVRRLREFYRPFSETNDERQLLNLNRIVEESLQLAEPKWNTQCQARGIYLAVETELQEIPDVAAAAVEIREVLLNLIFNAVDAMPQGGTIVIRTRQAGDSVVVEVEDNGTGMTEETRKRCLEPFYSTKRSRGTGLGLAIAYGIIKRHNGHIGIETTLNKGTRFSVTLPVTTAEICTPDCGFPLPMQKHLRVLVVDDDPSIRAIVSRFLMEDEHSVTVAENGCEALEKFSEGEFDLVLTDRVMPKMNGDQLARTLREISPTIPIILLTGFDGTDLPSEADYLVSKPATHDAIRQGISWVMMGKRLMREWRDIEATTAGAEENVA